MRVIYYCILKLCLISLSLALVGRDQFLFKWKENCYCIFILPLVMVLWEMSNIIILKENCGQRIFLSLFHYPNCSKCQYSWFLFHYIPSNSIASFADPCDHVCCDHAAKSHTQDCAVGTICVGIHDELLERAVENDVKVLKTAPGFINTRNILSFV